MRLTREKTLELHRQMWSDMKRDLGDTPDYSSRVSYKKHWCETHGFLEVASYCFLCEYVDNLGLNCGHCPIKWPGITCGLGDVSYSSSPISKILALPEKIEK